MPSLAARPVELIAAIRPRVLAAVDVFDHGGATPDDISPQLVLDRFQEIVAPVFPHRSRRGWMPLWHLTNNGAWTFYSANRPIVAADFGTHRGPRSEAGLLRLVERARIPDSMREAWQSPTARAELADDEDPDCALMWTALGSGLQGTGSEKQRRRAMWESLLVP
jgi:hypothetical protein